MVSATFLVEKSLKSGGFSTKKVPETTFYSSNLDSCLVPDNSLARGVTEEEQLSYEKRGKVLLKLRKAKWCSSPEISRPSSSYALTIAL